ncbi:hypothetical protein [Rhodococcus sp. 3-2]|uniref:hypothetical protein n=1 Tax=Rhodococcus sp. 3-2 TaxID=2890836 RepID=UPI0009C82345|nr:hypothetical protein [Rhodococcus sp. 3-2]MCC4302635.1 hypothetical protein [Rhodococcus sp. 3-2]OMQ34922.1 hypothetical protein BK799_10370 [Rhodococcus sp. D-1]
MGLLAAGYAGRLVLRQRQCRYTPRDASGDASRLGNHDRRRLEKRPLPSAIFASKNGTLASIAYGGPTNFTISGRPAIRYTATVTNIPADNECDPPSAQFDVVTTPGYSTAEVMVFLVQSDQGLPDALNQGTIDQIIATIRKSETQATAHG